MLQKLNKCEAIEDFNENVMKNMNQIDQIAYLDFKKGDILITVQQFDNGWLYGYKESENTESNASTLAFFPYTYVKILEDYTKANSHHDEDNTHPQETNINLDKQEKAAFNDEKEEKSIPNDEKKEESKPDNDDKEGDNAEPEKRIPSFKSYTTTTWMDYASRNLIKDEDLLVDSRYEENDLDDNTESRLVSRNLDCILGYKKIKINDTKMHAGNSGKTLTQTVEIKDQAPLSKAYRLINHYFDYDKWIEEMNAIKPKKAKPDPSKKKLKKKTLNW